MNSEHQITFRRLVSEDAPRILRMFGDSGHGMLDPSNLEAAKSFMAAPYDQFAVVLHNKIVGEIHLKIDSYNLSAELGYVTAKEFEGQSVATQAIREITRYGFRDLNMNRLWARTSTSNVGSFRALQAAGFIEEARLREARRIESRFVDEIIYRLLKSEWCSAQNIV